MLRELNTLIAEKRNVCIYTDFNDTSKFLYGRFLCANEYYFVVYMFSCDGDFDGILVKTTDSIIRLEFDGQYEEKMQLLSSEKELPEILSFLNNKYIIDQVLDYANKTQSIVSIEICSSSCDDIVGFVEEMNNDMVKIKQVDEYGFDDGVTIIKLSNITQISFLSEKEKRVNYLANLRRRTHAKCSSTGEV